MRQGLFFVLLHKILMDLLISSSLPITGSNLAAWEVRSLPYFESASNCWSPVSDVTCPLPFTSLMAEMTLDLLVPTELKSLTRKAKRYCSLWAGLTPVFNIFFDTLLQWQPRIFLSHNTPLMSEHLRIWVKKNNLISQRRWSFTSYNALESCSLYMILSTCSTRIECSSIHPLQNVKADLNMANIERLFQARRDGNSTSE